MVAFNASYRPAVNMNSGPQAKPGAAGAGRGQDVGKAAPNASARQAAEAKQLQGAAFKDGFEGKKAIPDKQGVNLQGVAAKGQVDANTLDGVLKRVMGM